MTSRLLYGLGIPVLLSISGCGGCRDVSKAVTQKKVESVKDTVGGIQEGIDEGRTGTVGSDSFAASSH